MNYLIPPGKSISEVKQRDVSKDIDAAVVWIKENIQEVTLIDNVRALVQKSFPSLTNDEAYGCVMAVKAEWETPKEVIAK